MESATQTIDARISRPTLDPCRASDGKGLSRVDPDLVQELKQYLRAQTPECVMATFGISINTWVKIRDGQPIRRSVAERFLERVDMLTRGQHCKREPGSALDLSQ